MLNCVIIIGSGDDITVGGADLLKNEMAAQEDLIIDDHQPHTSIFILKFLGDEQKSEFEKQDFIVLFDPTNSHSDLAALCRELANSDSKKPFFYVTNGNMGQGENHGKEFSNVFEIPTLGAGAAEKIAHGYWGHVQTLVEERMEKLCST